MQIDLDEIKRRLREHGNYADIARRVHMTRTYIKYIATGERANPTIHTLTKIMVALDE